MQYVLLIIFLAIIGVVALAKQPWFWVILGLICVPIIYIKFDQKKEQASREKEAAERRAELEKKRQEEQATREKEAVERRAELEKKRQEEQAAREKEAVERRAAEAARVAAKKAAYQEMLDAIEAYPIEVSEAPAKKQAASSVNNLTYSTITVKTDLDKISNFVVIDTETTGLKYTADEIIEIAAIRYRNFMPVMKFSTLVAPHTQIPFSASFVNHITDDMVEGKPYFQQIAVSLMDFIGDDNIVGHNLPFDLKFIVRYGVDVTAKKRKYFDTLALSKKTIKKTRMKWDRDLQDYVEDWDSDGVSDYKLHTLCMYLGITHMESHRAEGDAIATAALFEELAKLRKNR